MLRRYWWPVWFAEKIETKPVPVRLLGEDFVLFRDGERAHRHARHACAHRRASLALGRVEDRGLRCCDHGWLYDAAGRCVEMPAEPAGSRLHEEVRQRAAAVQVAAGFVFAYLGPLPAPILPRYDLLALDDCDRTIWASDDHCNWAQRAENGVDVYHSMSLHASVYPSIALKRPEASFTPTWYGFRTQSEYPGGNRNIVHDIFPSSTRRHNARVGTRSEPSFSTYRVPIDDHLTTTYYVKSNFKPEGPYKRDCRGHQTSERGVYQRVEDGWWGLASEDQDRAAQESQGLIHDRTREFLGTSDRGVVMWRKLAFEAIDAVRPGKRSSTAWCARPHRTTSSHSNAGKNFSDADKAPVSA